MAGNNNFLATSNTTNNTDRRAALQDAVMVGDGSSANVTLNMQSADAQVLQTLAGSIPDAAVALMQGGSTLLRDAGGAIVDLNRDSLAANTKAWEGTVQSGAAMVDDLIGLMSESFGIAANNVKQGTDLASKAIDAFQPTENKNADIGKYAMLAAAAVALLLLLNRGSK